MKKFYADVKEMPRIPEDAMQYFLRQLSEVKFAGQTVLVSVPQLDAHTLVRLVISTHPYSPASLPSGTVNLCSIQIFLALPMAKQTINFPHDIWNPYIIKLNIMGLQMGATGCWVVYRLGY